MRLRGAWEHGMQIDHSGIRCVDQRINYDTFIERVEDFADELLTFNWDNPCRKRWFRCELPWEVGLLEEYKKGSSPALVAHLCACCVLEKKLEEDSGGWDRGFLVGQWETARAAYRRQQLDEVETLSEEVRLGWRLIRFAETLGDEKRAARRRLVEALRKFGALSLTKGGPYLPNEMVKGLMHIPAKLRAEDPCKCLRHRHAREDRERAAGAQQVPYEL